MYTPDHIRLSTNPDVLASGIYYSGVNVYSCSASIDEFNACPHGDGSWDYYQPGVIRINPVMYWDFNGVGTVTITRTGNV